MRARMIRAIFIPQVTRLGDCGRRFRFVRLKGKHLGTLLGGAHTSGTYFGRSRMVVVRLCTSVKAWPFDDYPTGLSMKTGGGGLAAKLGMDRLERRHSELAIMRPMWR
jgi:hypothetical protein